MSKRRLSVIIFIIIIFICAIIISSYYYKDKYVVSFETGTSDEILNQYVDRNSTITMPKEPIKEGYIFIEWQYEGKSFEFDTEIRKDMVLTAKWLKEEYVTISFNTQTEEKIGDKKILKGSNISDLPIISKENYEFIGWFISDQMYNGEAINENITLIAKFKYNPIYKIGDIITITGCYSDSSNSKSCNNTKAIGWNRVILNIIKDVENQYVIGNEDGITGFFKEDSIKKGVV